MAAGSFTVSASSPAILASTCCRSINVRSCASTGLLRSSPPRWAHLDSNQDRTGYEPGALPLSYGPACHDTTLAEAPSRARAGVMLMTTAASGFEEAPQLLRARRVAELAQRLGLDLADALAGHRDILTDLL